MGLLTLKEVEEKVGKKRFKEMEDAYKKIKENLLNDTPHNSRTFRP